MTNRIFTYLASGCIATLFCFANVSGQATEASAPARPNTPVSQTISLDKGQKQRLTFSLRETGSITIKVGPDAETTSSDETNLGPGVKISLRSADRGFENWVIEQYTDASGTYTFESLRAGNYVVDIEP